MDLHVLIEEAAYKASDFVDKAETRLKAVLIAGLENSNSRLMEKPAPEINWNEKIDELMDFLYESFDEIYDYNTETQIENFYRVVREYVKLIINNKED